MQDFYADCDKAEDLRFREINEKRLCETLSRIEMRTGRNRVLDVGCGCGQRLALAAKRGWEVFGIEISESALRHLAAIGVQAFGGDLTDAAFASAFFDVAYVSEVLKHVLNPQVLIKRDLPNPALWGCAYVDYAKFQQPNSNAPWNALDDI